MIYLRDSESSLKTGLHRLLVHPFILDTEKYISDTKNYFTDFHAVSIILNPPSSTIHTQSVEVGGCRLRVRGEGRRHDLRGKRRWGGSSPPPQAPPLSHRRRPPPTPPLLLLRDWYGTYSRKNPPGYLCRWHHQAAQVLSTKNTLYFPNSINFFDTNK